MLLLPHHYEFGETLANLPQFYNQIASQSCEVQHILQKSCSHVPEIVNTNTLREYLLGGEVDQFVEYIDGYADEETEENDNLIEPWELGDEWLGGI